MIGLFTLFVPRVFNNATNRLLQFTFFKCCICHCGHRRSRRRCVCVCVSVFFFLFSCPSFFLALTHTEMRARSVRFVNLLFHFLCLFNWGALCYLFGNCIQNLCVLVRKCVCVLFRTFVFLYHIRTFNRDNVSVVWMGKYACACARVQYCLLIYFFSMLYTANTVVNWLTVI